MAETEPIEPGEPPVKCPSPSCEESIGFELVGVEFEYGADADTLERVATHRVAKWKCSNCGCEISFFRAVE